MGALRPTVHESRWPRIRILGGLSSEHLCTVRIDPTWKVIEAKGIIEREEGTPWYQQRLVLDGRILSDGETLSEALMHTSNHLDVAESCQALEAEVLLLR